MVAAQIRPPTIERPTDTPTLSAIGFVRSRPRGRPKNTFISARHALLAMPLLRQYWTRCPRAPAGDQNVHAERLTISATIMRRGLRRAALVSEIEVVAAALVAGAAAGLQSTASTAMCDAYVALKDALRRRLGTRQDLEQVLDVPDVDRAQVQALLGNLADGQQAARQVVDAARRVLALADSPKSDTERPEPPATPAVDPVFSIETINGPVINNSNGPMTFSYGPSSPVPPASPKA